MGIRRSVLLFLGIIVAVALLQMALTWSAARGMAGNLQTGAESVIGGLGGNLKTTAVDNIATLIRANASDFETILGASEKAAQSLCDVAGTFVDMARQSEAASKLAADGFGDYSRRFLEKHIEYASGIGASFEIGGFSAQERYFFPYAYREDGKIAYSAEVPAEPGVVVSELPAEELERISREEIASDYYATAVPKGHDLSIPLPETVAWSSPYIDTITHELVISATVPVNHAGRVAGMVFIDLGLPRLKDTTVTLGKSITKGTIPLAFDFRDNRVLIAPNNPEWAPEEKPDPKNPAQKAVEPRPLASLPFGAKVVDLAAGAGQGQVAHDSVEYNGGRYVLYVASINGLFGLAILVPEAELFASVDAALAATGRFKQAQERELASLNRIGLLSIVLFALAAVVVYIFLGRLTRRLDRIVGRLDEESDGIASASAAISDLAHALAGSTTEQSASLASVSATMEEITGKVRDNAATSDTCDQAMRDAGRQVEGGAGYVREMTVSMSGISEASEKIGHIIKTIESIAFQTNLLALNAAVEAARAGEAGKGFAVVADEVRGLAQRSAQAAKETTELIADTINRVSHGSESVERLETGFKDIQESVRAAGDLVSRIRSSTNEQAQAIDTVNTSVGQIDQGIKANEEAANRSASTSRELSAEAANLRTTADELSDIALGNNARGRRA